MCIRDRIGIVKNGDRVTIDAVNGKLEIDITDDEIKERSEKWTPRESRYKTGVLAKYAKLVSSASDGAICK